MCASPGGYHQDAGGRSRADQLRLQLAQLRRQASAEEKTKHQEGEVMLRSAVELRSEQRVLRQEVEDWQREARVALQAAANSEARWGQSDQVLRSELYAQQDALGMVREEMQSLSTSNFLEDDPEEVLRECRREMRQAEQESEEYDESRKACEELSVHMGRRITALESEMGDAAGGPGAAGRAARRAKLTSQDVFLLRGEVKVLHAKVQLMKEELGDEARALWLSSEAELPRLRMRERERRKLQGMLSQARWDRDSLQREYDRVLRGLREQEEAQAVAEEELTRELLSTKAEGEEMIVSMRRTGIRLAEMRHDSWETECFVQHLGGQVERLEAERNKLRASFLDRSGGRAAGLGPDAQEAALAWMQQDHARFLEEMRDATVRDEEEARVVGDACREVEVRLRCVEERNAEMRSEVAALTPLLRGTRSRA